MVFAANAHAERSGPRLPQPPFFPSRAPRGMGEYLNASFGGEMVVIGSAFGTADPLLKIANAADGTFDAELQEVRGVPFALDLRRGREGSAAAWLSSWHSPRSANENSEVVLATAFDAVVFFPLVSGVKKVD